MGSKTWMRSELSAQRVGGNAESWNDFGDGPTVDEFDAHLDRGDHRTVEIQNGDADGTRPVVELSVCSREACFTNTA
jgi:hypothetical protein